MPLLRLLDHTLTRLAELWLLVRLPGLCAILLGTRMLRAVLLILLRAVLLGLPSLLPAVLRCVSGHAVTRIVVPDGRLIFVIVGTAETAAGDWIPVAGVRIRIL